MAAKMEQDFTVHRSRRLDLNCPFRPPIADGHSQRWRGKQTDAQCAGSCPIPGSSRVDDKIAGEARTSDSTHSNSVDPIFAATCEGTACSPSQTTSGHSSSNATGASSCHKCPIRYMDRHSPEKIAEYVERHKHEIPRSHEVCLRRYQRNEDQIRKLDAKYGSLVTMIADLSQLHQPMLPLDAQGIPTTQVAGAPSSDGAHGEPRNNLGNESEQRVKHWAHDVHASAPPEATGRRVQSPVPGTGSTSDVLELESHFDRPLKEVRVGESPSRPWGIAVPVYDSCPDGPHDDRPISPPPAPVMMPSTPTRQAKNACAGDLGGDGSGDASKPPFAYATSSPQAAGGTAGHTRGPRVDLNSLTSDGTKKGSGQVPPEPTTRPAFIQTPVAGEPEQQLPRQSTMTHMLFTGPVFIGYPVEQAIQFMQHFRSSP